MSWRDRLGPATFRGVPFHVESAELSGGRRQVLHEYPGRDLPFAEDMGRKARKLPVEGYLVGEDYQDARDALLTALEAAGPGELVHPYHGTRRVAVETFRVRESTREGGYCTINVEFIETPDAAAQPVAAPDAVGAVRAAAEDAREASVTEFLARFNPGVHVESLSGALRSATLAANNAASRASMQVQEAARMRQRVDDALGAAESLIGLPSDLAAGLVALVGGFGDRRAVLSVYSFNPGVQPPMTTPSRQQERTNFDALQRLVQRLAVVRAAELVADETFDSYEAAVAARESVTALLDDQAEAAPDDVYPALATLRTAVVGVVPPPEEDLPRLVQHTPAMTLPSLVLAYELLGDLSLEGDLVARNRVANPCFVPGGIPIEVLTRA